jgi:hypothetical protein
MPTLGIASVTSMNRAIGLHLSASRIVTGSMCRPSTIRPHQLASSSSAAPTAPGSRLVSGDIALNKWVKPARPASSAARMSA